MSVKRKVSMKKSNTDTLRFKNFNYSSFRSFYDFNCLNGFSSYTNKASFDEVS